MIVDAHAMRRYYERPEQPQQQPRREPDPTAPPTPRPDRPEHDFHARVASFGSTPALLRRLGLAVDVVLDGVDAAGARAALAGATWVSVTITSPAADLEVLPPRRTSVVVDGAVFAAQVEQRVGGRRAAARRRRVGGARRRPGRVRAQARPAPPQPRPPVRQRGQRRPGDVGARHAALDGLRARPPRPGGAARAAACRRPSSWPPTTAPASCCSTTSSAASGSRCGTTSTKEWHSLHRRRVTVTGEGTPRVTVLDGRARRRVPAALGAQPGAGRHDERLLPARGRRRLGRLEPVRAAARPDDRARRAAGPGRRHRGRRRHPAGRADRWRAHDRAGRAGVAAAAAVRNVVQLPGARRRPGRQLGAAGPAASAAAGRGRTVRRSRPPARTSTGCATRYGERDLAGVAAARRAGRDRAPADRRADPMPDCPTSCCPATRASTPRSLDLVAQAAVRDERGRAGRAARPRRRRRGIAHPRRVARHPARAAAAAGSTPACSPSSPGTTTCCCPTSCGARPGSVVTTPRPYLRWEPVPAPALVARQELGTGEQPAAPGRPQRHPR